MIRILLLTGLILACIPVVQVQAASPGFPSQGGVPGRQAQLPASPVEAVLYPKSALLTVKQSLRPVSMENGMGLELILPWNADPATLTVNVADSTIQNIRHSELPLADLPDGAGSERDKILQALEKARSELAAIQADVAADEARVSMWSNPHTERFTQADEIRKLDEAMDRALRELHGRLPAMRRLAERKQSEVSLLETRLENLGSERTALRRVAVMLDKPGTEALQVTYSYRMSGCGWQGSYRFDARPEAGIIAFSQEALLWQSSGVDWKDTELSVATIAPGNRLSPGAVPPWVARVRRPQAPAARQMAAKAPAVMYEMADNSPVAGLASPAPEASQMGTYTLWKLGKKTLPTGENLLTALVAEQWKTDFYLTIRPMADPAAYLTAKPKLAEAVDLPVGQAMFLVDGSLIRQQNFQYSGQEPELFFGVDPLILTEVREADRSGADRGIISKSRAETWRWDISVTNTRNRPVSVQVEEALPRSTEEAVSITVNSSPKPEEKDTLLIWKSRIGSGDKFTIRHEVKMTAPADVDVIWGR